MSTQIIQSIRELDSQQQQTIIDLLVKIQDGKIIKPSDVGLLSYDVEKFPVTEFYKLFNLNSPMGKHAKKLVAEHPIHPFQTVNLKLLLEHIVEREVIRRMDIEMEKNQSSLLDFAGEEQEKQSTV